LEDVSVHNQPNDAWIIIDDYVYDITKFIQLHPGGKRVLLNVLGKDATSEFYEFHKVQTLQKYSKLQIGRLESPKPKEIPKQLQYSDPSWSQGFKSPYWNDSHKRLRDFTRSFVEKEITPFCFEWEESRSFPKEIHSKMYQIGLYPGLSGTWPSEYCDVNPPCGIRPQDWNYFHESVILDEIARCGSQGVCSMLSEGIGLGLPPILSSGSEYLKKLVAPSVCKGEKIISLCITESTAGSDVSALKCVLISL
jgi:hypothetical protein